MTKPIYSVHLMNANALEKAFEFSSRTCKQAIRRGDSVQADAMTRNSAMLLGALLENRLMCLIYARDGLAEDQRTRILKSRTIEDTWKRLIIEAFASRRNLRPAQIPTQLNFTDRARYDEINKIIADHITPLITMRNSLAHGQWYRALTSDGSEINQDRTRVLLTTRLWHLRITKNLLKHLVSLAHDLIVTRYAFERDFDKHWADLHSAKRRLDKNKWANWEAMLRQRHENGKRLARDNQLAAIEYEQL